MVRKTRQTCVCGHDLGPHEHYRGGSECSLCPPPVCPRFRPSGGLAQTLRRLVTGSTAARGAGDQVR